jgi:hypothetical protein
MLGDDGRCLADGAALDQRIEAGATRADVPPGVQRGELCLLDRIAHRCCFGFRIEAASATGLKSSGHHR